MHRLLLLFLISNPLFAQQVVTLNLYDLQKQQKLIVLNREVETLTEKNQRFIRLSEKGGEEGLVWIPVSDFKNGVIELKLRGKDVLQKSFIGIAFHALNDSTYDAVYCRPFNFFAKDSVRKLHAIQYISHPIFTWKKLREEKNGMYEKEIIAPPDPNGWFTLKVLVANNLIRAYINEANEPALTIEKLSTNQNGKVGIFVGAGRGGDFESISIQHKK
jgi:hypothetical protein